MAGDFIPREATPTNKFIVLRQNLTGFKMRKHQVSAIAGPESKPLPAIASL